MLSLMPQGLPLQLQAWTPLARFAHPLPLAATTRISVSMSLCSDDSILKNEKKDQLCHRALFPRGGRAVLKTCNLKSVASD